MSSVGTNHANKCINKKKTFPKNKENSGLWWLVCDRLIQIFRLFKYFKIEQAQYEKETREGQEKIEDLEYKLDSLNKDCERNAELFNKVC